jgi:glycosyltransferase involved in cell wall biosynthesis
MNPGKMLRLSFIVSTRNRADVLRRSLESIAASVRQASADCELIIVDNGSTDATPQVARDWAASAPLSVRVVHEPSPGLANARNAGLEAAQGHVLAFTDDDCRLAPDFVAHLLAHFARDSEPVVRGGRVELGDPADLPFTIRTEVEPAIYTGATHPGGFVHGCNMSLHRAVVARIGRFDAAFGAGARFRSAEDTEYVYRAHRAGIRVEYVPDCVVYHDHGRRRAEDIARLNRAYAEGNGALYAKYFSDRKLLRNLAWDAKGAIRELLGGPIMDPRFGFTFRANIAGCVTGMMRYALYALRGSAS